MTAGDTGSGICLQSMLAVIAVPLPLPGFVYVARFLPAEADARRSRARPRRRGVLYSNTPPQSSHAAGFDASGSRGNTEPGALRAFLVSESFNGIRSGEKGRTDRPAGGCDRAAQPPSNLV